MKKKILSIVLAVVMLLSCIPVIMMTTASADSTSLSFSSVTFQGYKGWMDADKGGQERYKQRGNDLGLQAGTLSNILSGSAAQAQSNNVGDYYPELYLNASGQLVRDNTYDNVNTDVNLETYLASGLGKYYGVYKFKFANLVELNTFTVYNQAAWWHLNRGFDILASADGTTWTKVATYTGMGNYANWDSESTTSFGGKDCLLRTTDMGDISALYVAVAVTDPAGGGPNCALWYATATGRDLSLGISKVTFTGYKGWLDADEGGQERYKQRGYDLGLQAGTLSNITTGSAAQAQSNNVGNYYPELYLNAAGQLVRDNTYDNVNTDVNLDTYLANGLGKYYGVYKIQFSGLKQLDTFTVYNRAVWWHLNRGFDILASADGTTWTKVASYTNMGNYANWDSETTTSFGGQDCLLRTTDMGGINALYVAVAVTEPAGGGPNCALWYATATGRDPSYLTISTFNYKAYQAYLSGSNSDKRKWDNNTVAEGNAALINSGVDSNKGGTIAYKAYSRPTKNYYPDMYLNSDGVLVHDGRYDNNGTDVVLESYLAEGVGKYYGVFKLQFSGLKYLDTFTVYNNTSWYHLQRGFDVMYSADGTVWTKVASYTDMGNYDNWSGQKTVDGSNCLYKTIDMGGVCAQYVAVAITSPAGQDDHRCCLWYADATGRDATTVYASNITELRSAILYGNANTGKTIKLTSDIVCENSTTFGTISGTDLTLDGQNHTIYNLRQAFVTINGAGVTVKNLTISNQVAAGGANISLSGNNKIFGDTVQGGTSAKPVVIENITNQRDLSGVSDLCGMFARTASGYVIFRNCTNAGNITAGTGGNYKVSGFLGQPNAGSNVTFDSCTNTGAVSGSQAGGFIGVYEAGVTVNMTNCSNTAVITGYSNSSAYGTAGGMIGGFNNGGDVGSNTYITLTGCKNTGDIVLSSTADNDKNKALGGLIGHAGGVTSEDKTTVYRITLNRCEVYGCQIDAANKSDYYAAGLVGKISPKANSNVCVLAENCYLSKVGVSAGNARKFVGVGSYSVNAVSAENCVVYNLSRMNGSGDPIAWGNDAMTGCSRIFTANSTDKTGFSDTDTANVISGGGSAFVQTGTNKIRFVATLPTGFDLTEYTRAGFYVVALTPDNTDGQTNKVWIKNSQSVYGQIYAGGETRTASSIVSGSQYLFVCELTEIPSNIGTVTFYLTPYVIDVSGKITFGTTNSYAYNSGSSTVTPIKLMSYNIKDGEYNNKGAETRKTSLANNVKNQNPDIVCVQEVRSSNDSYHITASNFASACSGTRTYTSYQTSNTAVLWDSSLYTKVSGGTANTDVPQANGGDKWAQSSAWVLLRRKSDNEIFYVISAHFDTNEPVKSAENLKDYIKTYLNASSRVIVAGDFNLDETRKSTQDQFFYMGYSNANQAFTNVVAANENLQDEWNHDDDGSVADYGLTPTYPAQTRIIDWCYYTTDGFIWNSFSVVSSAGTSASDHYPILATLKLRP